MATVNPGFIGPYRLLNVVHTSQTCQIWQAYHDGKDQLFGVKTLLKKVCRDREQVGYLRWEYKVGYGLSHKRIIRAYEYDTSRGIPYMVMEWFSAPNLKHRIRDGIDKILYLLPKVIERAAEGLAYFNQQGWVHRDIKPDNFLVDDEGQVKLIDFALARRSRGRVGKLLAGKSKLQGTRSYMAPEQIRGGAVDIRADVYSFGCTLHHMFCGRPPFTGDSPNELLNKHLKTPPPSLEVIDSNITQEFSRLVRRTLAKDPAARPQSLTDFLLELRMIQVFRRTPRPAQPT